MKVLLALVTVFLCLNIICIQAKIIRKKYGLRDLNVPKNRLAVPEWGNITQRLDHFDPTNEATWTMRFMNNSEFFQPGGPIFIFIGGEWEISASYLVSGQMYDMAAEHNGYMFYTEHRYYGKSIPTEDLSESNLKWLSADQALADLSYFITKQKELIPELKDSKVVVTGGSYSASLATWARMKYPHLIEIGYSSSAPLLAIDDFYQYYEVVNENIGLNSQECLDTIRDGTAEIEVALTTPEGRETLAGLLNTCVPINPEEPNRSFLFNSIAEVFAGLVQYAEIGQISTECNKMLAIEGSPMVKLATYVKNEFSPDCIGDYNEFITEYGSTELTDDTYRQWLYQSCTEYGYWQTTTSPNQPFGNTFPIEFFHRMCVDLFGPGYTDALIARSVERTNIVYGSITPQIAKVVSVHGNVDPWHAIGLSADLSEWAPVMVINGTSHCADLSSISVSDIPEMAAAKQRVKDLVTEWLA